MSRVGDKDTKARIMGERIMGERIMGERIIYI